MDRGGKYTEQTKNNSAVSSAPTPRTREGRASARRPHGEQKSATKNRDTKDKNAETKGGVCVCGGGRDARGPMHEVETDTRIVQRTRYEGNARGANRHQAPPGIHVAPTCTTTKDNTTRHDTASQTDKRRGRQLLKEEEGNEGNEGNGGS